MTTPDAVLFDHDGVIVEPPDMETIREAGWAAFEAVGVHDPADRDLCHVVDGVTAERLGEICEAHGIDREAFWAHREQLDARSQVRAFLAGERGLCEDVDAISQLPQPIGLVSNNHRTTVEFTLNRFGLDSLFETVYGRPMTVKSLRRRKPAPYYIVQALADLGADSALYVGDSESDLIAAQRAGIEAAFLRRSHTQGADLAVDPAHEITTLHDLADIVV